MDEFQRKYHESKKRAINHRVVILMSKDRGRSTLKDKTLE